MTHSRTSSRITAVALSLVMFLCVGCSAAPNAASAGHLIYAVDSPFLGFDPNVTPAAQDARVIRQVFDNLLAKNDEGEIEGWLAESYEQLDEGQRYTFQLRDNVKFHDGTPLDAEAVCFNFERIVDPATGSRYAVSLLGPYKSCTVEGPLEFTVEFERPYAPFLSILTSPFMGIVSPTAVNELGDQFNLNPVGSGPFKFVSYSANTKLELEANDEYDWPSPNAESSGAPKLQRLTFQIVPDPTVRLGSVRANNVQVIGNIPETEAGAVAGEEGIEFYAEAQSGSPYQLNLNTQRPVFNDVRVRQAYMKAIDVQTIVDALYFGVYQRATTALSPETPGFAADAGDAMQYDPDEARRLLDEAGWKVGADGIRHKDGQPLTVIQAEAAPNREKRQDVGQFVQSYAKKVGFDVQIRLVQVSEAPAFIQKGEYDVYGLSLVNVDANVLNSLYNSRNIPTPEYYGFNFTKATDMDDMLLAASEEIDDQRRNDKLAAIQRHVIEQAYSLPIYVPTYTVASNGVTGLTFDAEAYPSFYDVELDGEKGTDR